MNICNLRVQINLNIEKITFKVVQIKFLTMHITNQKLRLFITAVRNVQNIFMEHDLIDFWHKIKIYNFDPYTVLLTIATNIPQRFMIGFVLQDHIYDYYY